MYSTSTARAKDAKLLCVEKGCPIDQTFLEFFESNIFIQKKLLKNSIEWTREWWFVGGLSGQLDHITTKSGGFHWPKRQKPYMVAHKKRTPFQVQIRARSTQGAIHSSLTMNRYVQWHKKVIAQIT